jgi:uncharacterized OB-fold protein
MIIEAPLARPLPAINGMNDYFWCGGADGRLHIMRCGDCGIWFHPYQGACAACGSRDVKPQAASGRGTVIATTVNHQPWFPHVPVPYIVALVELEERGPVRLVTNLMNVAPEDARAGMAVEVYFEKHGDIYVPLFAPV